ncbi:MAG: DUF1841 family protein [Vulcanimicrobiota bacterium]
MIFENIKKKEHFLDLWKNKDNKEQFDSDDALMLSIMENHKRFHDVFNSPDVYDILNKKSAEDPFFHITIHYLLQKQLLSQEPPEVKKAFDILSGRGVPEKRILHGLGLVLADEMFTMLKNKASFNENSYRKRIASFIE